MTLIHIGGHGNPDGTVSDRVKCDKCGAEDWRKPIPGPASKPSEWIGGPLCLFCEDPDSPSNRKAAKPAKPPTAW